MLTLRPGSHVHRLMLVLSAAGEFPARSLHLLGNERSFEQLIYRLTSVQQIRSESGEDLGSYKLITVSGRKDKRTIRLYRGALPLLQSLHPAALDSYLDISGGHRFSGNDAHVLRNHRVAETLAMCLSAGIEFRPYALPPLQKQAIRQVVPDYACFYAARTVKKLDDAGLSKTSFTRLTGALFCPGSCYAVYNTRGSVMKWSGMGEFKTVSHLTELARMNAGLPLTDHALLLGERMDIALQTLLESDKTKRMEMRFDRIYPHIHFVPLGQVGIRLLKLLTHPDRDERILSALFPSEWRRPSPGVMEYDAQREGTFILSHLDSDIARLIRLRQALEYSQVPFEIICFPWQSSFLREYLGKRVQLREIDPHALESELGLSVPDAVGDDGLCT